MAAETARAVELRDSEFVAAGSPALRNDTGTVRLEVARLGRLGPLVFLPEPGALCQLGTEIGLLALLAERRRSRAGSDTHSPDRADPTAPNGAEKAVFEWLTREDVAH